MKLAGANIARVAIAGAVVTACYSAYRAGGGADLPTPPPRAASASAPPSAASKQPSEARGQGESAYQVKLRLNEALDDARIDAPALAASKPFVQGAWRRLAGPWTHPSGLGAQMAMAVSLRTSRQEMQWTVSVGSGKPWTPDARIWNMNEGSFDQRESIFAPTPATIAYQIAVPEEARLEFSPALLGDTQGTTVFTVSVADAAGNETELTSYRIQPGDARRWFDAEADLSKFAGQSVELRLKTWVDKPSGSERKFVPPPEPPPPSHKKHGEKGDKGEKSDNEEKRAQPIVSPPGMALALWGNPRLVARAATSVPYNVLWIVIDALRPDVIASFHDDDEDRAKLAARHPPLEALLPDLPGVTPNIDELAKRGVRFMHAYSAAAWTRPGTLAMLAGARSTEIGIDTYNWVIPKEQSQRYYLSEPTLLPLIMRKHGVETRAFVNNFFMTGYAAVGLDFGFERMVDHRHRTEDTKQITDSSVEWLRANKDSRFFLFANYNSPHDPYEPPLEMRKRIPLPPVGPKDQTSRLYMAEAAKDDEAVGTLMQTLDDLGLRKNTIVVLTADHGETLSQAHSGTSSLDNGTPVRFHHAIGIFEETTRVPILVSLPGNAALEEGKAVYPRVRNIDLAPTILDLEGLPPNPRMSGKSLLPVARGEEKEDRVVVSEGREMRAIMIGNYRLIEREKEAQFTSGYGSFKEELFDLDSDPGERHNLVRERPDVVADLRDKLDGILKNARADSIAGTVAEGDKAALPTLHLRFAGMGQPHAIQGTLTVGDGRRLVPASIVFEPVGVPRDAIRQDGAAVSFSFATSADAAVGLDLKIDPPAIPVAWKLLLDGKAWPDGAVFVGPFGLAAQAAKNGLLTDEARFEVFSPELPAIDLQRDLGLFVTRDRRGESTAEVAAPSGESAAEMNRLMQEWGYAHGSGGGKH